MQQENNYQDIIFASNKARAQDWEGALIHLEQFLQSSVDQNYQANSDFVNTVKSLRNLLDQTPEHAIPIDLMLKVHQALRGIEAKI